MTCTLLDFASKLRNICNELCERLFVVLLENPIAFAYAVHERARMHRIPQLSPLSRLEASALIRAEQVGLPRSFPDQEQVHRRRPELQPGSAHEQSPARVFVAIRDGGWTEWCRRWASQTWTAPPASARTRRPTVEPRPRTRTVTRPDDAISGVASLSMLSLLTVCQTV